MHMKFFVLTILYLTFHCSLLASDTTISFRNIAFEHLLPLAKMEQKDVMLYFHFDGCSACIKMEKTTFKDYGVFDFYNTKFINFEINTSTDVGKEINKLYNIQSYPTFLFLDHNGNEKHRIVGVYNPQDFLTHADNVLSNNKSLSY